MPLSWGTYLNFECIYIHKNITPFISVLRACFCFVRLCQQDSKPQALISQKSSQAAKTLTTDTESSTDCGACRPAQIELSQTFLPSAKIKHLQPQTSTSQKGRSLPWQQALNQERERGDVPCFLSGGEPPGSLATLTARGQERAVELARYPDR